MIAKIRNDYVKIVFDENTGLFAVDDMTYCGAAASLKKLGQILEQRYGKVIIPINIYSRRANNLKTYIEAIKDGYDYAINLDTGELHKLSLENFDGAHNISTADFCNFIFVEDIGNIRIEDLPEGFVVPIFILGTDNVVNYKINKCKHCYPQK